MAITSTQTIFSEQMLVHGRALDRDPPGPSSSLKELTSKGRKSEVAQRHGYRMK